MFSLYRVIQFFHVLNICTRLFVCLFDMLNFVGPKYTIMVFMLHGLQSSGMKNPRHR